MSCLTTSFFTSSLGLAYDSPSTFKLSWRILLMLSMSLSEAVSRSAVVLSLIEVESTCSSF